jgi:hypothetical protein
VPRASESKAEPRKVVLEVVVPLEIADGEKTTFLETARRAAHGWSSPCAGVVLDVEAAGQAYGGAGMDGKDTLVALQRSWCRRGRVSGPCYPSGDLAVTTVFSDERPAQPELALAEADIELNAVSYDWFGTGHGVPHPVPLEMVLAHEMGHVLGLEHVDELTSDAADPRTSSIMTSAVHYGRRQVLAPTSADLAELCSRYPREGVGPPAEAPSAGAGSVGGSFRPEELARWAAVAVSVVLVLAKARGALRKKSEPTRR